MGGLPLASSSTFSVPRPELIPLSIDPELWSMAEHRIHEIICTTQPALESEKKREEAISYIIALIKAHYTTEVFAFGSVSLKTYLPDGDIDLTLLSHRDIEDELTRGVLEILHCHEHDSKFVVQDVQYVEAQVKIIKCLVNGTSVDISFNQLSGLSALCFLEQVDQIIGKDHLFKKSIILIKAWCYYESRILGAIHGLFSTYALEILVLHIFNMFHSSLIGPLAVLYKFLDYYSSFDWDNYGVCVNGVFAISSLPDIVVELPVGCESRLLLGPDFLRYCQETFAVPVRALEDGMQEFQVKSINIVDPLKESNNLGRSVRRGNFYRIQSALPFGARKLRQILTGPGECLAAGLENFFRNTIGRNGRGQRPDADNPVPPFGTGRSEACDLNGDYDRCHSGLLQGQWYHNYQLPNHFHQLSSPPSQNVSRYLSDFLARFWQERRNVFSQIGTESFMQREMPVVFPCPAKRCVPVTGINLWYTRPKGTGTYIPDAARYAEIWYTMRHYRHYPPQSRQSRSPMISVTGMEVDTPSDSSSPTSDYSSSYSSDASVDVPTEEATEQENEESRRERDASEED
ncbi:hypothetical protein LINGRAHAP2_LOCUS27754 [Linum grandiflorum]